MTWIYNILLENSSKLKKNYSHLIVWFGQILAHLLTIFQAWKSHCANSNKALLQKFAKFNEWDYYEVRGRDMLPYYNVTGERNFYAISVGKYSEFSDVECYQEDAYQLADGFKFKGKFLLK